MLYGEDAIKELDTDPKFMLTASIIVLEFLTLLMKLFERIK